MELKQLQAITCNSLRALLGPGQGELCKEEGVSLGEIRYYDLPLQSRQCGLFHFPN